MRRRSIDFYGAAPCGQQFISWEIVEVPAGPAPADQIFAIHVDLDEDFSYPKDHITSINLALDLDDEIPF